MIRHSAENPGHPVVQQIAACQLAAALCTIGFTDSLSGMQQSQNV